MPKKQQNAILRAFYLILKLFRLPQLLKNIKIKKSLKMVYGQSLMSI